jgi:hypothetical protein
VERGVGPLELGDVVVEVWCIVQCGLLDLLNTTSCLLARAESEFQS